MTAHSSEQLASARAWQRRAACVPWHDVAVVEGDESSRLRREVVFGEDRRKHIDLIQQAVARMASASSTAKGWLLPVVTASYGFALDQGSVAVGLLGVGATVLFGTLDAHYLRQERAFRALYREAINGRVNLYEMNNRPYYDCPNGDEDDMREENCRWQKVAGSWAIAGFYLPIVLVGLMILATNLSVCFD